MRSFHRSRLPRALSTLCTLSALSALGCVGSTGGDTFSFEAFASGTDTAANGAPFVSGLGYTITLTRARVHVGAVYLNRSAPTSVSAGTSCTLSGVYVAEVPHALDVDALSTEPQRFPSLGQATAEAALTGEVWLTGGDVNDPSDDTVILDVAGTAERSHASYPFEGQLTIGENRLQPMPPALPGLRPICKERIVTPVPVAATPVRDGRLTLRVDASRLFSNVDFALLEPDPDGVFHFDDDPSTATPASDNLYIGLRATSVYRVDFEP